MVAFCLKRFLLVFIVYLSSVGAVNSQFNKLKLIKEKIKIKKESSFEKSSSEKLKKNDEKTININPEAFRSKDPLFRDSVKVELYNLVNQHRIENGLNKLDIDTTLETACKTHSQYVLSEYRPNILFYMHAELDKKNPYYKGKHCWNRTNCKSENVVIFGDFAIPMVGFIPKNAKQIAFECFKLWKNSPGHNENMLNPKWTISGFDFYATITWMETNGVTQLSNDVNEFVAAQLFR